MIKCDKFDQRYCEEMFTNFRWLGSGSSLPGLRMLDLSAPHDTSEILLAQMSGRGVNKFIAISGDSNSFLFFF
jgi:hypothetical protein